MNTPRLSGLCGMRVRCALLFFVSFCSYAVLADTPSDVLDRLNTPEGARVQVVSDSSLSNGFTTAIATLQTRQSIDRVFSFYRQRWAKGKVDTQRGYVESVLPGWRLISRLHEGHNIVIQLNTDEHAGAAGFISVMAVDKPAIKVNHGVFSTLSLLSSNRSVDGADTSSMRVYASPFSVLRTHRTYRQKLIRARWQVLSDSDTGDAVVMVLARDQVRLELSVIESAEYGSVVVVHELSSR